MKLARSAFALVSATLPPSATAQPLPCGLPGGQAASCYVGNWSGTWSGWGRTGPMSMTIADGGNDNRVGLGSRLVMSGLDALGRQFSISWVVGGTWTATHCETWNFGFSASEADIGCRLPPPTFRFGAFGTANLRADMLTGNASFCNFLPAPSGFEFSMTRAGPPAPDPLPCQPPPPRRCDARLTISPFQTASGRVPENACDNSYFWSGGRFFMDAFFSGTCECCEYRQHIRRVEIDKPWWPDSWFSCPENAEGLCKDGEDWVEDSNIREDPSNGCLGRTRRYGQRNPPLPERPDAGYSSSACEYHNSDRPSITWRGGLQAGVTYYAEFRGRIIDTCNNGAVRDEMYWNVCFTTTGDGPPILCDQIITPTTSTPAYQTTTITSTGQRLRISATPMSRGSLGIAISHGPRPLGGAEPSQVTIDIPGMSRHLIAGFPSLETEVFGAPTVLALFAFPGVIPDSALLVVTVDDEPVMVTIPVGSLPIRCDADTTADGGVTIDDLLAFLEAFALGHAAADFDTDGGVTIDDLLGYLERYAVGC